MVVFKKRDLLALSGILLIACTDAQSVKAQYSRPAEPQNMQAAAPVAPRPPSASPAPQQMLYYVCGKPGIDSHVTSPDPDHPFNMAISFVSASDGALLSDVAVKVRRHGRVLMDFVAAGPHCLFSVPDADYRIEGTYRGEMKFEIVQTGNMNARIKW
ncbi:hypothetical protein [Paraburkholderia dinghuensis]|nr:hypothetical protein [Paraburkholderia dinghuensis]